MVQNTTIMIVAVMFVCSCCLVTGIIWASKDRPEQQNSNKSDKRLLDASIAKFEEVGSTQSSKSLDLGVFHDEHVVIIGDSISRYHYLSLVYNIRHGHALSDAMHPSLVCERQWHSWQTFYFGTNGALYPERCDCYREQGQNITRICENRYYTDMSRSISVTYYQSFGSEYKVHGHWSAQPQANASNAQLSLPLAKYIPPSWEVDLRELYAAQIAFLVPKPTILVLNTGWWVNTFDNVTYAREVIDSLYPHFDMLIWRTVTANATGSLEHGATVDRILCSFKEVSCMDVSWTANVSAASYWDRKHFYPPVYHRMNHQLAGMIKEKRNKRIR